MTGHPGKLARIGVKKLLRTFGYSVLPLDRIPKETLAGLKHRPIRTIIDCGANEGQFARYISRFFPNATMYCFEPLDEPFKALSSWAATQNGRVKCFRMALGEQEGAVVMHRHLDDSTSSSLLDWSSDQITKNPSVLHQTEVTVPISTLDAVLEDAQAEMEADILLKLDVQGYEDRVLRGAPRLLERVKACLLEVNVDPMYADQATFTELVQLLDRGGLTYAGNPGQCCSGDGHIAWLDALFVRR